jgi:hypothetical protein
MKKLALIVLSVFLALPAFSQVNFGLKAGVSTTNLKMEDVKTVTSGDTQYLIDAIKGANYGFHAGAFVRFILFGFYIQPELLFASRTDEYTSQMPRIPLPKLLRNSSSISLIFP